MIYFSCRLTVMKNNLITSVYDNILKRPNQTIGFVVKKGSKPISNSARKLYSAILLSSQAQGNVEIYTAEFSDLLETACLPPSNHKQGTSYLEELLSTVVTFSKSSKDEDVWGAATLIQDPKMVTRGNGVRRSTISWTLSSEIKKKLTDPESSFYTYINLQMMTKLKSDASVSLFEICNRWSTWSKHKFGENLGATTALSPLEWMNIITGEEKDHGDYRYFRRDLLKPALLEINEHTNLNVEAVEVKKANRVQTVQFIIAEKVDESIVVKPIRTDEVLSQKIQAATKISKEDADTVIAEHSKKQIETVLSLMIEKQKTEVLLSPAKYFYAGVTKKWKKVPVSAQEEPKAPKFNTAKDNDVPSTPEKIEKESSDELRLAEFESMDESDKAPFINDFLAQASSFTVLSYKRKGLKSGTVVADFIKFLRNH